MIKTFKFAPKFSADSSIATLGEIPAGRIIRSESIIENGKPLWLIEVDTDPKPSQLTEIYLGPNKP